MGMNSKHCAFASCCNSSFRDIHAASNHAFLNSDKGSLNAGFVQLGGMTADFIL